MEKKYKLIYWILTILMFVPGVIGGVVEVFTDGPESIVKIMLFLGYRAGQSGRLGTWPKPYGA